MTTPSAPEPVLRERVLAALRGRPDGTTAADLAHLAGPSGSALHQTRRALAQLEAQGLAHRRPGPRPAWGGRPESVWRPAT